MKRITIKDLAEMLNINISTVSRALSNHPDISTAVKLRVKEAAELLNYRPNDFAVNFRKRSSKTIGLIIPQMSLFFIPAVIEGISKTLAKAGFKVFILSSEESLEKEKENMEICCNSNVEGILISVSKNTKNLDHLCVADQMKIPIVLFDKSLSQDQYPQVIFDSEQTAMQCAEKLVSFGCKNIFAIYGDEKLDITIYRKKGFETIILQYPEISYHYIFADSSYETIEKLLETDGVENMDGFFAMSDETLLGLNPVLKMRNTDLKHKKIVAISEGVIPQYLNPLYEYENHSGLEMGILSAEKLLEVIKENALAT